jgi:hypothetical protein
MRDLKDRSCQWLLDRHPAALLQVAGERVHACRALRTVLTAPKRIPDGLLEVKTTPDAEPEDFLVEIAAYPDDRVADQVLGDLCLAHLLRERPPEVLVLVLLARGSAACPASGRRASRRGRTTLGATWHVVELWNVPARPLLTGGDVGLVPLVPLMQLDQPPEVIARECKDRIDQLAPPRDKATLLAVTHILAEARFHDALIRSILGGKQNMIESPTFQEIVDEFVAKRGQNDILRILEKRFGPVPSEVNAAVRLVTQEAALNALLDTALDAADLAAFRSHLPR